MQLRALSLSLSLSLLAPLFRVPKIALLAVTALVLTITTGCTASVPLQSNEVTLQTKQFAAPSAGKAGLYIYRDDTWVGAGLYKDIYVDGMCLGETAPGVFFYTEVDGNKNHTISTESEFSPNEITVYTEAGKHYFFEQYMKLGVFVWGADIRQVDEQQGKLKVDVSMQATPGTCSNM